MIPNRLPADDVSWLQASTVRELLNDLTCGIGGGRGGVDDRCEFRLAAVGTSPSGTDLGDQPSEYPEESKVRVVSIPGGRRRG
jgi:hypothetical protein